MDTIRNSFLLCQNQEASNNITLRIKKLTICSVSRREGVLQSIDSRFIFAPEPILQIQHEYASRKAVIVLSRPDDAYLFIGGAIMRLRGFVKKIKNERAKSQLSPFVIIRIKETH